MTELQGPESSGQQREGRGDGSYRPPPAGSTPDPSAPASSGLSAGTFGSGGYGSGDVIVAGPPQGTRRLAPVITSVIAVLAIILAGGGFTAYKLLASNGSQPDKWAPANSIAYAKLDLDPSASAKVAAWEFERKFPEAPKVASADQLKDALLTEMFASDPSADVNYDTDIKPWLGDRLAVAVFPDAAGKATAIGIIGVTDAGKARAGIEKIKASSGAEANTGYSIQGAYAIVGENQATVDAAVSAARKSNITSNPDFNSDLAQLKGDRVVTAWWDLGGTLKAVSGSLPPEARGLLGSASLTGLPSLDELGRVVMGVRVQSSYVEIEGRVLGAKTSGVGKALGNGDAGATLGELPSGSVMGVALANPEQLIKTELATLSKGLLGASLQTELDQAGAQLGIKLPGDVENLLGSGVAIGRTAPSPDDPSLASPLFTLLSHPDDVTSALSTAKLLAARFAAASVGAVEARAQGSTIVITNDKKTSQGKLGDDASFKSALGGLPDKSFVAGYVNIGALAAAIPGAPSAAKHLDGLGFYVGADSTSPVFGVRLTIK